MLFQKIRKGFSGPNVKTVSELKRKIMEKQAVIGVIGLGYIGLSLLDSFGAAGFSLVGYDSNDKKMEMLARKKKVI